MPDQPVSIILRDRIDPHRCCSKVPSRRPSWAWRSLASNDPEGVIAEIKSQFTNHPMKTQNANAQ
jgi:hypothetical protein